VPEKKTSFTPDKPAYWFRGFDGVERGCTPGMHRALHTSCQAVDHEYVDEKGGKHVRKLVRVHHNPWSKYLVDKHQHRCVYNEISKSCACCDSFILHTPAPTPSPEAKPVEGSAACRWDGWLQASKQTLIDDEEWGGEQKGIAFNKDAGHTVCSTTPDEDAASYLKHKVSGAFEFSFNYDDGESAAGGINRFLSGFWVTDSPGAFQSTYPEDEADGLRYFFSPLSNEVLYATKPGGKVAEHRFSRALFKPGARITLARHQNCDVVLYQDDHKLWTYKNKACGDGYVWFGHYKGGMHKSCLNHVTLCKKPVAKKQVEENKGPRCRVIRNRGEPQTGSKLQWGGDLTGVQWNADKSQACGGNTNSAILLQKHVYGNFEFGFTYDGLYESSDLISRFFGGFWQVHDSEKGQFTPNNPDNVAKGPRYYWKPVANELMYGDAAEHVFEKGDYKGYKGEMSLVPGFKKPRAHVMLVRYNGRLSLFKNGWRMYEWSEENHKDGFLWLGHNADTKGTFCVNDVYVCN